MNSVVHGERSAIVASFSRMVRWTIGELKLMKNGSGESAGREHMV